MDGIPDSYSRIDFGSMTMDKIIAFVDLYYDKMLEMIENTSFDILTHLTCPLRYINGIANPLVTLPATSHNGSHVYHIFAITTPHREQLRQHLLEQGIETLIHYPIPPHRQEAMREFSHLQLPITEHLHACELSLPCHQAMSDSDVKEVINAVNSFIA